MNPAQTDPACWKLQFQRVSFAGIGLSFALALWFLFSKEAANAPFGVGSNPITWTQLSGELLILVSIFQIPPALNVNRYRAHAWIAALCAHGSIALLCLWGVTFLGAPTPFLLWAAWELSFGGTQAFLLAGLSRAEAGRGLMIAPAISSSAQTRSEPTPTPSAMSADDRRPETHGWRKLYCCVAWIGIAANAVFVLPLVFVPHWMLAVLGVASLPVIWAQMAGLLLGLVSVFYIPATRDPDRYRLFAWLAIFPSRAGGVLFCTVAVVCLGANEAFLLGVLLDLPFAVAQTVILARLYGLERPWRVEGGPGRNGRWAGSWPVWAAFVAALTILGTIGWHKLLREFPQKLTAGTMEERFKHGSIGAEDKGGLPYWLWLTLPAVFPEYLPKPGGYASLGFLWEPGAELPVGFSRKKIGFDRIGINCAICHAGSVQIPGEPRPRVYLGAPATTVNILEYQRFLFACANDPRFNAARLLAEIGYQTRLSLVDRILYRMVLIPATRKELKRQSVLWQWTAEPGRPAWGPGRIEPFNPVKVAILGSVNPAVTVGATLGTSDMAPIWKLGAHAGRAFHWDGLNTDLREVVDSSALGDGATQKSLPRPALRELQAWLESLPAPPNPFTNSIQTSLLARGAVVYRMECAKCHAADGGGLGKVIPARGPDGVGTDENRAFMWTPESAAAYNAYLGNLSWRFQNFRSTHGYVNVPLDGLWIRAPYLHNGSVPTLRDLLETPAGRPTTFWRGLNDYDSVRGGFISSGRKAEQQGFLFDTTGRGNSNQGHLYGTSLPAADKDTLVEYLKTL